MADRQWGRGVSADLDSTFFGMECWGGTDGLRSSMNIRVGDIPSSSNHVVWWDGDLLRELLNSNNIRKYEGGTLLDAAGCSSINGTKSNPNLQADLFGDWREEVIWRTSDNYNLRIYTTTDLTKYRIKTLMHDPVYRLGIAWQNVAYNQPPHTGFYLGAGMFIPDSTRPPSAPRGLALESSADFIMLTWNENYEGDLAGYNVYRSDNVDGNYKLVNDPLISTSSFTDSGTVTDVLYFYHITALDTSGNESFPSPTVSGASTLKPDWPNDVKAVKGNGSAYISWEASVNVNVFGYNLYRSLTPGSGYNRVNTDGLIETPYFTDGDLTNGTLYYYAVTAVDNEGRESFYSQEVSVTPGIDITLQAEDNIYSNCWSQSEHPGYHGSGYVNFSSSDSYLEFRGVYSESDGSFYLVIRYALGNSRRTGNLIVNGASQALTVEGTGAWTNYVYDSVIIKLVSGFDNTIRFEATGQDFGNVDEISIGSKVSGTGGTGTILRMAGINPKISIVPNPFNRQTVISVGLDKASEISIELYNALGQKVKTLADRQMVSGQNRFVWSVENDSGRKVNGGVYFCRIVIGSQQAAVRRILVTD